MLERTEIQLLREKGHHFKDPFEIVELFEKRIATYCGAPYAIAVDCCTHAVELSLRYLKAESATITVPRNTYLSIPMTIKKIGGQIQWSEEKWIGDYSLSPYPVIDASVHFRPGIYRPKTFVCLSFQQKKTIPIGRGGMILTDNADAAEWLIRSSYDGRRRGLAWKQDQIQLLGYHYYMTPEDAARGLLLLEELGSGLGNIGSSEEYPDISIQEVFR